MLVKNTDMGSKMQCVRRMVSAYLIPQGSRTEDPSVTGRMGRFAGLGCGDTIAVP